MSFPPARLPFFFHTALRHALALLAWLLLPLVATSLAHAQATAVPISLLGAPVQQMAGGENHSCALTAGGAVYCWGSNANGQLGTGSIGGTVSMPAPIAGLGGVVAIAAGGSHSCALKTSGELLCWGGNASGQLGIGSSTDASTPQAVAALGTRVVAMALGGSHSCALTTVGEVHCWGSNVSGGLGNGSSVDADTPQLVTGLAGVAAIAAGGLHTCAVTAAGGVKCWGDNTLGQLGSGSAAPSATTPVSVTGLAGNAARIAAGFAHTCVVGTAGALQCWGRNNYGQLGNGSTSASANTPQAVTGMASGVAAVAGGLFHTCALTTAGAAHCWGDNTAGFLGNGGSTGATTPQPVTGQGSGVAALGAGYGHTCAATTAGALQCWGDNFYGQLGDGSTTHASTPRPVAVLGGAVTAVDGGFYQTCALSASGGVHCWGLGEASGSLGFTLTPQPISGLATGVVSLVSGSHFNCALTASGTVQCWGLNDSGQLGDGTTTASLVPKAVTGLPGQVQTIAAGFGHVCAIVTGSGALYCWGRNYFGQLGDGTGTDALTPKPVPALQAGVKAIAAGGGHTCAITSADAVMCWGFNGSGQLGNGTSTNSLAPSATAGLTSNVAGISAGTMHTCALTTAGAMKCWGSDSDGQVGDGSNLGANTPQDVIGLGSGLASITTGASTSCAVDSAGALWCWGYNLSGQLGNGTTASASVPTAVTGLGSGVQSIMAGESHACAVTAGGGLQCWGQGYLGQLGNGAQSNSVPQPAPITAGQTIDFPTPSPLPQQGTSTTTLAATAGSGLAVQFESWTPDVCSVSGTTLTVLPGTVGQWCGVRAVQPGGPGAQNAGYAAARPQGHLLRVLPNLPGPPTAVAATAGEASATVRWTAPASDGGGALTGYTVTTVEDSTKTCTVSTGSPLPTTCTVAGLTNGMPYTFTVRATNAAGDSVASAASTPAVRPEAPAAGGGGGPTAVNVSAPGSTTTITNPAQPIIVGPDASGATIVVPGTGTAPVTLQVTINGQPLQIQAMPGTQFKTTQVNGQTVLVLVVLQGSASMTSTAAGQPMALAGTVLLSSGAPGTRIDAQPLTVAVVSGSLLPPSGSLPALGDKGLMAGERLLVDAQGKLVSITLGSIKGDGSLPGDAMVFTNLPTSVTVDGNAFARIGGTVARLAGVSLANGLEIAASGVILMRDGTQVFQLLPTQPISIDTRLPDGLSFTPLGLLRWVRGGVVVQFAPAVADLAGLASAVTAVLPGATLKLGAEGVIQLTFGGATHVLKPDWTGAGSATGTPSVGVDAQGRIYFQIGTNGARQLLLPALLNATQASSIFTTALPGAVLAVQPGSNVGALTLTLGGAQWRLVPQWVLPSNDVAQTTPWRMGADGVLYLKLGTQVQGLRIAD